MPIFGPNDSGTAGSPSAFALGLDTTSFVTKCTSVDEARSLPPGAVVGDLHGGLTFPDNIAAALEARSIGGWHDIEPIPGQRWTIIVLNY